MKEHYMSLNEAPFEQIKNGEKTVELRLFDEKRRLVQEGDVIYFSLIENATEVIKTKVISLHKAASFATLLSEEMLVKSGFAGYTKEEAIACMRTYYTAEKEEKYGVLGIEIQTKED